MGQEQHGEPEVMEESVISGGSGAADQEATAGTVKSDVNMTSQKCSVLSSLHLQHVTNMSSDAQEEEDKDEKGVMTTLSKAADEEVANM